MMRWDARAIAGFAQRAGWSGDDLADAVAVALAWSAGDDRHRWRLALGLVGDRVGLWGVSVVDMPEAAADALFDPNANARAAYGLWRGNGPGWLWAPVDPWAVPYWQRDEAAEAARRPASTPPVPVMRTAGALVGMTAAGRAYAARLADNARQAARAIRADQQRG